MESERKKTSKNKNTYTILCLYYLNIFNIYLERCYKLNTGLGLRRLKVSFFGAKGQLFWGERSAFLGRKVSFFGAKGQLFWGER